MPERPDDLHQEEAAPECFIQYVRDEHIQIHSLVRPHRFPGHGLGIRSTGTIEVCYAPLISHAIF